MKNRLSSLVYSVAQEYLGHGEDIEISALGRGNINATYLVVTPIRKIVLQRINSYVFPDPELVIQNCVKVSNFLKDKIDDSSFFPEIVPTPKGKMSFVDSDGGVWRGQLYFENTTVFDSLVSLEQGYQVGKTLALFHRSLSMMSVSELTPPIPGFHNLSRYLANFSRAKKKYTKEVCELLIKCYETVERYQAMVHYFEDKQKAGKLAPVVIHGDPKVSNFLFDEKGEEVVALIDPDTIGPGLKLYDIGDCLRSCCCSVEEKGYGESVECNSRMVEAVLQGYLKHGELSSFEKDSVAKAHLLITFELGLRFLTDYLQNNIYFTVEKEKENLHRALVQFGLVESIVNKYRISIEQ